MKKEGEEQNKRKTNQKIEKTKRMGRKKKIISQSRQILHHEQIITKK